MIIRDTGEIVQQQEKSLLVETAQAREQSVIQAGLIMAKKFPRDEEIAYTKIIKSFQRGSLAERAQYRFPRGGATVQGPSVDAARELARCWGNIHAGFYVVEMTEEQVHIKGFCYDLETNYRTEQEDKFSRLVQRKNQGWVKPDERDLRELINRRAAILERNCILKCLPSDIVDDAIKTSTATLKKLAAGQLTQNKDDTIRSLVVAFDSIGISKDNIEDRIGHKLENMSADEIVELRGIYKSIQDGNTKRDEHFNIASIRTDEKTHELSEKLKAKKKEIEPQRDESAEPNI